MTRATRQQGSQQRQGGYRPGAQGIVVPDYYRGGQNGGIIIPGSSGQAFTDEELPEGYVQTGGIIHRDMSAGVVARSSRVSVYFSRASAAAGFPAVSAVSATAAVQAVVGETKAEDATREAVHSLQAERISAGDQDFVMRLADAMRDVLNERFRRAGQPTIEQALAARKNKVVKDLVYRGDDVMKAVRGMCRGQP